MPKFNRWHVCEAWYFFAVLYHEGQFSNTYKIFGRLERIKYRHGDSMGTGHYINAMHENTRAIFDNLIERHGYKPYQEET